MCALTIARSRCRSGPEVGRRAHSLRWNRLQQADLCAPRGPLAAQAEDSHGGSPAREGALVRQLGHQGRAFMQLYTLGLPSVTELDEIWRM